MSFAWATEKRNPFSEMGITMEGASLGEILSSVCF